MCGILFSYHKHKALDTHVFKSALTSIAHRGPDDMGVEAFNTVNMGSIRLAIQDLSPNGHMPMKDSTGRYVIVYNGEVYNFKEIIRDLSEFDFVSGNDTEVILYSYIKWGVTCLQKFRGMFALVIYDTKEDTIFFARDRFGKKPVLYHHSQDELLIGSEAKALLTLKPSLRQLDSSILADVLAYRYPTGNKTGFKDICSLPAGSYGLLANGVFTIKKYWDPTTLKENRKVTFEEAVYKTESLLSDSISYRLIADVPVGVFLSGGVDSSIITALAAKVYQGTLQTYTIGYANDDSESELTYAKEIADRYSTDHHEIRIDLASMDVPSEFENYFRFIDRPIADPAIFPSFIMSREVSKFVKVVLNGDGGDELFGGYPKALDAAKIACFMLLPQPIRQALSAVAQKTSNRAGFLAEGLSRSFAKAFLDRIGCFHNQISRGYYVDLYAILKPEFYHDPSEYLAHITAAGKSAYKKSELYDLISYMPDDTLPKVDFATMAASLEGRSPLLDHVLAEFALTIPYSLKMQEGQTKVILKKIAEKCMSSSQIYTKKRGFAVPFERWFRNDLYVYLQDTLLAENSFLSGFTQRAAVERVLRDHKEGVDYSNHLWVLLTIEKWGKKWL